MFPKTLSVSNNNSCVNLSVGGSLDNNSLRMLCFKKITSDLNLLISTCILFEHMCIDIKELFYESLTNTLSSMNLDNTVELYCNIKSKGDCKNTENAIYSSILYQLNEIYNTKPTKEIINTICKLDKHEDIIRDYVIHRGLNNFKLDNMLWKKYIHLYNAILNGIDNMLLHPYYLYISRSDTGIIYVSDVMINSNYQLGQVRDDESVKKAWKLIINENVNVVYKNKEWYIVPANIQSDGVHPHDKVVVKIQFPHYNSVIYIRNLVYR